MLHIIGMLIVGLIVGALARFLLPGKDPMGLIMTALLGIAGSFLGGFIGQLIWPKESGSYFQSGGFWLSLLGALLILGITRMVRGHQPAHN
jgi:uncharacterized membrane protein YeaQ/YmgE (transglycosylase-associated protein family)